MQSTRSLSGLVLFVSGLFCALALNLSFATAQQEATSKGRPARRVSPAGARRNAQIAKIVSEIDARNIERTIRRLVSFGTRNSLSDQQDPQRGIGAARDWLFAEFQKAALQSGGRMTVEKQTFEQAKAARVPEPTMMTNVV